MGNTEEKLQDIHNFMSAQSEKLDKLLVRQSEKNKKEDRQILSYVNDMCTESLDPDTSDKWVQVMDALVKTRNLNN